MIKKMKEYFQWEKDSLKLTKEFIIERNRSMLIMLQSAMIVSYVSLLIFSLIKNKYSSFQMLYAFMLIYMLICLVMIIKTPSMPAGYLTYGVYIVTIFMCMYAAAFVDPDHINSEAYIFFLLFPILYVDSSLRLDLINIVLSAIYLYNIIQYKTGKALMLDAINIVCFSLLGVAIGHFVRWRTLRALVLVEQTAQTEYEEALTGLPNHQSMARDLISLPVNPQAVIFININEFANPLLSFGLHFQKQQLRELGDKLAEAADEQGINLYCSGTGIVGLVQPRLLEGVFQRLEPLYQVLSGFEFHREDDVTVKLHFGIGGALCDGDIEQALEQATAASNSAQQDGKNRIVIE